MRNSRTAMMATCLVVAACAGQPAGDSTLGPISPTMGDEAPERLRARVHTELAAGYYDLGNMAVSLEEVKEALRADSNYGPAHNVAGLVYGQLKEDGLAEESFRRALDINSADSDANNNYGEFLCQRKRESEAIKHFLAAVRNPLYTTAERSYVNAGVCARRSGDAVSAEQFFLLALKLSPAHPRALYQMADLSFLRADYVEAKNYLNRLTKVAPVNAEVLWLGVRVERRLGDRNSEASYASQLRNKFPNSREARALSAGRYE